MILGNLEICWIELLILLIYYSHRLCCIDYLIVSEDSNFEPCVFNNNTLTCNALNKNRIFQNKTIKVLKPNRQKILKIELLHFSMEEIPENLFRELASDILSIKIVSKSSIKIINSLAFIDCKNVLFLEIISFPSLDNITIDFDNVFSPLRSLEELRLINLNIQYLTENYFMYLANLKSLTIESTFFRSMSTDTFRNNKNLTSLTFIGMKDSSKFIETLENWPSSSTLLLKTFNINKCNLKKFPKLSENFVRNLSQLSLAKNPIEQIDLNDTVYLTKLEVLSLVSTKLNWYSVPGLKLLTNLKDLKINDVITLKDLPVEIESMESLESISLDMSKFEKISISLPASIKKISASNLQKPTEITSNFLSRSRKLNILYMIALPMDNIQFLLDNIKVINSSLIVLSLDDTSLIKNRLLEFLGSLRNLEVLHLNKANIDFISDNVLYNLSSLKKLMLSGNQLRYEAINTYGFQSVLGHLTDLDLSKNPLTYLPACMFYTFSRFDRLNLQENSLVCDCHLLWLHDTIKRKNISNNNLNFTCSSGYNEGRSFLQLSEKDLKNCSSNSVDNCNPWKNGIYKIPFSVTYKWDSSTLSIFSIESNYLKFLFDYFTIDVKQSNTSLHTEFDKYDITRTTVELSFSGKLVDAEVCLILNRNKVDYKYNYNCKTVPIIRNVLESKMSILIGVLTGVGTFALIVFLVVFFICRRWRRSEHKGNEYYEASSTEYSEPDDTYKSPDQYTEISNNDYSIDQGEVAYHPVDLENAISMGISSVNRTSLFAALPAKSVDNIHPTIKTPLHQTNPKFRKRSYMEKLISKARSSSNLCDRQRNSLTNIDDSISMQDLKNHSVSTLPRQYLNRELPMAPNSNDSKIDSVDFGPPKPRLSNYNIQQLLKNTDEHLKKFSQYVSNSSVNSDRLVNRRHSDDISVGISNCNGKLSDGTTILI